MRTIISGIKAACTFSLIAGSMLGQSTTWSHNPAAANGPLHWGAVAAPFETCGAAASGSSTISAVGMAQTPVDIATGNTVSTALPNIAFRYEVTPFEVENTGHVVEVSYPAGSSINVGSAATDNYQLAQFHFHAPSEHTLNGKQYAAEIHFVHKNMLGQLLVVGVLLNESGKAARGILDEILAAAPLSEGTAKQEGHSLNANSILPEDRRFFTYAGSLTTPPCTEGVRWFVLQTPIPVTEYVIRQLHLITGKFPGYDGFANNNRPILSLNGRKILNSAP
jgi:carbonic anhydrase